jgi:hypothetical protein
VRRQHLVEVVGLEPAERRPARHHDADREQAADQQPHHGDEGVGLDEVLGLALELQARARAGAVGGGHNAHTALLT